MLTAYICARQKWFKKWTAKVVQLQPLAFLWASFNTELAIPGVIFLKFCKNFGRESGKRWCGWGVAHLNHVCHLCVTIFPAAVGLLVFCAIKRKACSVAFFSWGLVGCATQKSCQGRHGILQFLSFTLVPCSDLLTILIRNAADDTPV